MWWKSFHPGQRNQRNRHQKVETKAIEGGDGPAGAAIILRVNASNPLKTAFHPAEETSQENETLECN